MRSVGVRLPAESLLSRILATILIWLLLSPNPAILAGSRSFSEPARGPKLAAFIRANPYVSPPSLPALVVPAPDSPASAATDARDLPPDSKNCISLAGLEEGRGHDNPARTEPEAAGEWGDISIAQPKIWPYERVNTYLDGLLRDVEGVSLSDLTQLNPNAQNAGATNSATMQTWQSQYQNQQQQLALYNSNMQQLDAQRNSLTQQMVAQSTIITNLQRIQASGTTLSVSQSSALAGAQQSMGNIQTALTSVNSAISSAGAPPAPPTAPASGTSMSSTFSPLQSLLSNLPPRLTESLRP